MQVNGRWVLLDDCRGLLVVASLERAEGLVVCAAAAAIGRASGAVPLYAVLWLGAVSLFVVTVLQFIESLEAASGADTEADADADAEIGTLIEVMAFVELGRDGGSRHRRRIIRSRLFGPPLDDTCH